MNWGFIRKLSSFTYLNVTQFLGALNDNIYKLLIVYLFIEREGIENSHTILATTGAIFVLPFLLFSTHSGILADRFSKRNIIVWTKVFELVTVLAGVLAFIGESKIGSYVVLFMMATQSALFSPAKYGIIPEIVESNKISRANGMMTSFTFLAIIFGTFLPSFILDVTGHNFLVASLFCVAISVVGLATSWCIEHTPPSDSCKRFDISFLSEIYGALQIARQQPSLLMAVLGSSFFLFLGSFVQLNMIPFAVESLHLTDVQGGYLFLLTALGIGTGCVIAGKLCGQYVELGLPPLAALGVIICCFSLDLFSDRLMFCLPLVVLLGLFGGMYQVPLDAYTQMASPKKHLGQIIAAANFLSYFGVLLSSGLLFGINVIGFSADKGFTIIGAITFCVMVVMTFQYFDYLTRFICAILSRLHFQTTLAGIENIPASPAVYVCTHIAWNDALLLLGAQPRRMRFFICREQEHSKWMKRLYRLLRVVMIPEIEPLQNNKTCLETIHKTLEKGISVCIFTENPDILSEIEKLKKCYSFTEILEKTHFPMVPVAIAKGEKLPKNHSPFITRLLRKFRIPAGICFGSQATLFNG